MIALASVTACAAAQCSFNDQGCNALAITVGGTGDKASCATFVQVDARAPLASNNGQVGACQRLECRHNADLLCQAEAVSVDDQAVCLTYELA